MREPGGLTLRLADEAATVDAGSRLAAALEATAPPRVFVTLAGELGAGKTTFVRGLLRALGVAGPVRSPTYTLLETYPTAVASVHHLDWYRLGGEDDLEGLGFRDVLAPGHWIFAEWPERAAGVAGQADVRIELRYDGAARCLEAWAATDVGRRVLAAWRADCA